MRESIRSLQALPLFAQLTVRELEELHGILEERTFDKHQVITREGTPWDALYVVKSGKVKLTRRVSARSAGRELIIAVLESGDPVNMTPLFEGDRDIFTTEALTRATLYHLAGSQARAFVSKHPSMQKMLLRALNLELRRLVSLASRLAFTGVTARLALWIFEQTQVNGICMDKGIAIRRDLTLNELAALVGTVRRVISKSLTDLQHDGVIEVAPTQFVVLNEDKLAAIAGARQRIQRCANGKMGDARDARH